MTLPEMRLTLELPDVAICRAKQAGVGDDVVCLLNHPSRCKYAFVSDSISICRHPERDKVVVRTEWSRLLNH